MTYKELKLQIKEEQKSLAQAIRELKSKRKSSPYGYVDGLEWATYDYRHKHIAYCQFFNKTPYGMIEQYCEEDPNSHRIEELEKRWESEIDELNNEAA
jgi:hypothetical protein